MTATLDMKVNWKNVPHQDPKQFLFFTRTPGGSKNTHNLAQRLPNSDLI